MISFRFMRWICNRFHNE